MNYGILAGAGPEIDSRNAKLNPSEVLPCGPFAIIALENSRRTPSHRV